MMFTIVDPFTVPAKKLSEFESCSWTERDWSDGKRQRGRGRKTCIVRRNRTTVNTTVMESVYH